MFISKKLSALALALMGVAGIGLALVTGLLACYAPEKGQLFTTSCLILFVGGFAAFAIGSYLYGMESEREESFKDYKRKQLTK